MVNSQGKDLKLHKSVGLGSITAHSYAILFPNPEISVTPVSRDSLYHQASRATTTDTTPVPIPRLLSYNRKIITCALTGLIN